MDLAQNTRLIHRHQLFYCCDFCFFIFHIIFQLLAISTALKVYMISSIYGINIFWLPISITCLTPQKRFAGFGNLPMCSNEAVLSVSKKCRRYAKISYDSEKCTLILVQQDVKVSMQTLKYEHASWESSRKALIFNCVFLKTWCTTLSIFSVVLPEGTRVKLRTLRSWWWLVFTENVNRPICRIQVSLH